MIDELKKKYYQIIEIIELYQSTNNSDIKKILQHHLLITAYTSYEESIKSIVQKQFKEANKNYKVQPLLINSRINTQRWTPDVKQESMVKLFPVLGEWIIFEKSFTSIDAMIGARHLYAHTGSYTITVENILIAYIQSLHILFFINEIYVLKEDISIESVKNIVLNQKSLVNKMKKNLKECNKIIDDGRDIPDGLRIRFDEDINELRNLKIEIEKIDFKEHIVQKIEVTPSIHTVDEYKKCFNDFINTVEQPHIVCFNSHLSNSLVGLTAELDKCASCFS